MHWVEKPLALDLSTAERVVDGRRARRVILMTGTSCGSTRVSSRSSTGSKGALGQVRSIYARRLNLAPPHEKYGRAHPALMAQIHDIDLACW